MFGSLFGKYKVLVLSIALFLLFDLGVLVLNFYTSGQITKQTERINLAAQQRTLTQQLSKATLYIKAQKLQQWPYQSGLNELENHYDTFGETIRAFTSGGEVRSTRTGELITIPPVDTAEGRRILRDANQLWAGFEDALSPLMVDILVTDEEIVPASAFIARFNIPMYKLMNDLTNHFKVVADEQTTFLRMVQVIGISLATINFFIILFHFIRQLRQRDSRIELAQHESDQILNTIDEGVFLVDKELVIGGQHSRYFEKLFETRDVSGKNLADFLRQFLSSKTVETAIEYVNLFFAPHVNVDLVADINPLECVKATIPSEDGTAREKYLDFSFARLRKEEDQDVILVSVKDITDSVLLEEQAQESENKSQQQLALLAQILPIDPESLVEFTRECGDSYEKINTWLKRASHDKDRYGELIIKCARETHRLKGNAGVLGFDWVVSQLHEFEELIEQLRKSANLAGRDFLPLTIQLKKLIDSNEVIKQLHLKLSSYDRRANKRKLPTLTNAIGDANVDNKWVDLSSAARQLAEKHGYQVDVRLRGFDSRLNPELSQQLYDLSSQLIRNSIAHGFEPQTERESSIKPDVGQISLTLSSNGLDTYRFIYEDDGRGFDFEKIRSRIVDENHKTRPEADMMTRRELLQWVFSNDFSTAESADSLAGRGVGLPLVREIVKKLGGHLRVRTLKDELTQYTIEFPVPPASTVQVA